MTRPIAAAWVLGQLAQLAAAQGIAPPPPAPREFRAAWVATVDNIDWPSRKGLPVQQQKKELEQILDRARHLRLNALVLQVRPACDAFYPSPHEPWSEWLTGVQGRAPSPKWDPLAFAIAGAHARGLELHAWFNPFRARHAASKSKSARNHVSRTQDLCVRYGDQLWMDPGVSRARRHTLRVILDVVTRYDVDGIHIDDYFYPYPVGGKAFPDEASYRRYRSAGGRLDRDDWRRSNVDSLIEKLYQGIKKSKPWVKFGISPFGIYRPGVPRGIKAGLDQYGQLYADVKKWWREGWCDYLSPQLYWPIDQRAQSYPVLLSWWADQNKKKRHLWVGNYASRVLADKPWPTREIIDQVGVTRRHRGATGNIHFSFKALLGARSSLGRELERGPYATPALVPASPWLDDEPPAVPELSLRPDGRGGLELRWPRAVDVQWRSVYLLTGTRWRLVEVLPASKAGMRLTRDNLRGLRVGAVAVAAVDRCGNESRRAVRECPRQ